MKMIKVDDDVHARLKVSGNIRQAVRSLVFGQTDLDRILDQLKLMFEVLDDIRVKRGL